MDKRQPTFFISHGGGPCFSMDWTPPQMFEKLAHSLESIPQQLPQKPSAILFISAHWEESDFTIQTHPTPPMLYDYYGFPEHTYKIEYKARNSLPLIARLRNLFSINGIKFHEDNSRGYDHGLFVPMMKIYPKADVPILQLSMKSGLNPKTHFDLGRLLSVLRDENILIIGSGLSYHNLKNLIDTKNVSKDFDDWLTNSLIGSQSDQRLNHLINWEKAPNARLCHPTEDHLLPIMVVAGAALDDKCEKFYSEKMINWLFTSSSFRFG